MQYILTFVWSFLLITMLNYVVSSINAVPFDFGLGVIVSLVISVLVFIISAILPDESTPDYDV
ncbi:YjzD family protein [Bhargavaea cecembensis]|uniref:YjzD family protein n=1 Tax=Bhargavaea cecembensis TaxID=394098 RepID=UPI00058AF284|nr:YjzD family protein [Bhargavaea cecembensis]